MAKPSPIQRLQSYWVYGGTTAGIALLLLTPLVAAGWATSALLTYLCLPAYMLHQFEEHDDDRFRIFINSVLGKGRTALSVSDVYWINVLGVWVVLSLAIWATVRIDLGWSAMAAYSLLVNAVAHIGQAVAMRRKNPGVITACLVFVPLSISLLVISPASWLQHLVSFLCIATLHAAIVLRVRVNLSRAP
mgnify:CR=1 FL=1